MLKKIVRLGVAYMEEPVRIKYNDIFTHVDPQNLPISKNLKRAIQNWDQEYQRTLDKEYPPDSSFSNAKLEREHSKRGRELAKSLQLELGEEYLVEFEE